MQEIIYSGSEPECKMLKAIFLQEKAQQIAIYTKLNEIAIGNWGDQHFLIVDTTLRNNEIDWLKALAIGMVVAMNFLNSKE